MTTAYRHIFLFMDLFKGMYIAKKARTIKSVDSSEKVHMAKLPRGFDGDVRITKELKMDNRGYIATATAVLLSGVLVLISHSIVRI